MVFCAGGVQSLAGLCGRWWVTLGWRWFVASLLGTEDRKGTEDTEGRGHEPSPLQHFPVEATRVTKALCVCVCSGKAGGSHLLLHPLQGVQVHSDLAAVPLHLQS